MHLFTLQSIELYICVSENSDAAHGKIIYFEEQEID